MPMAASDKGAGGRSQRRKRIMLLWWRKLLLQLVTGFLDRVADDFRQAYLAGQHHVVCMQQGMICVIVHIGMINEVQIKQTMMITFLQAAGIMP